jgi:hypothetical protein
LTQRGLCKTERTVSNAAMAGAGAAAAGPGPVAGVSLVAGGEAWEQASRNKPNRRQIRIQALPQTSLSGSERSRCRVSAYTAFATAAETGAVAGSPIPPIFAPLSMMCTSTWGMSGNRSTR